MSDSFWTLALIYRRKVSKEFLCDSLTCLSSVHAQDNSKEFLMSLSHEFTDFKLMGKQLVSKR